MACGCRAGVRRTATVRHRNQQQDMGVSRSRSDEVSTISASAPAVSACLCKMSSCRHLPSAFDLLCSTLLPSSTAKPSLELRQMLEERDAGNVHADRSRCDKDVFCFCTEPS